MNPMWKVYKSKVLKTINPEYEEDTAEEVHHFQLSPSLLLSLIDMCVLKCQKGDVVVGIEVRKSPGCVS